MNFVLTIIPNRRTALQNLKMKLKILARPTWVHICGNVIQIRMDGLSEETLADYVRTVIMQRFGYWIKSASIRRAR